jgi:hypothetical protein
MSNWNDYHESTIRSHMGLILFGASASLAIILFLIFHPQIESINKESPILINIMFFPAMAVGFLYGVRITERAVKPSKINSKNFLILFCYWWNVQLCKFCN